MPQSGVKLNLRCSKWLLGVIFGKISFYRIAAIKIPVRIAMNFLMLKT